jgi:PAS domain-containing protein
MALSTAFQYLPIPILVLSSKKRVILANEAMKELIGINLECKLLNRSYRPVTLENRHISEFGIKILQSGLEASISREVRHSSND